MQIFFLLFYYVKLKFCISTFTFIPLKMKKILSILILLLIFSCKKQEKHDYGFYYWRTTLSLNQKEQDLLKQSKTPNLYTRFFDIDKTNLTFQTLGLIEVSENFSPNFRVGKRLHTPSDTFFQPAEFLFQFCLLPDEGAKCK